MRLPTDLVLNILRILQEDEQYSSLLICLCSSRLLAELTLPLYYERFHLSSETQYERLLDYIENNKSINAQYVTSTLTDESSVSAGLTTGYRLLHGRINYDLAQNLSPSFDTPLVTFSRYFSECRARSWSIRCALNV